MPRRTASAVAVAASLLCACAAPPHASPTLYERMGGERALRQAVGEMVDRASTDPHTARHFEDVNLAHVKKGLFAQFCDLSGGPCRYGGDPMGDVHGGMQITEGDFYTMVQILRDALGHAGVGEREKNELLRMLAPFKRDIVTGHAP